MKAKFDMCDFLLSSFVLSICLFLLSVAFRLVWGAIYCSQQAIV